jgi:hypothetical protein
VLFAAVLIHASHAALEDAKEALNCVSRRFGARIFAGTMIDGFVLGESLTRLLVPLSFVSIERAI